MQTVARCRRRRYPHDSESRGALGVAVAERTPSEREAFVKTTRPVCEQWKQRIGADPVNAAEKAIAARK